MAKKKGVARGHACFLGAVILLMPYHGTSLRTPFFFLLLDSLVLSPWVPESVGAASVLPASALGVSVVFVVPEAVAPLASVPVATAPSPLAAAGADDVDSPGVAELDSGCAAVPGALLSGAAPVVPD
jgi:hypothetical protein